MYILINISRSECNQVVKFGQLIWNITWETFFLRNHTQNVVEILFSDLFLKNQNWAYLWINSLKFYIVCQVEDYQNILKLSCRPLAFNSHKGFLTNKKRSGTSLPASFSAWFSKKIIYLVLFYYLTKFHCLVAFTLWDWEISLL